VQITTFSRDTFMRFRWRCSIRK